MAINSGVVRSAAAVYLTGAFVVGATVSLVWALGALALWWMPSMAAVVTGHADANPQGALVRLLAGLMVIMAALLTPAVAKLGWFFLGKLGSGVRRRSN